MKRVLKSAMTIVLVLLLIQTCLPGTVALAGTTSTSADFSVNNYTRLIETIAGQYIARDSYFTIKYTASLSEVQKKISSTSTLWNDVFSVDLASTTSDLDYLHNNMSEMSVSWQYSGTYAICEFSQTYLTTSSQESYVTTSVSEILSELNIDGCSTYGKIKAIHDYIINNVDYDYTYINYTAYNALYSHKVVCQGYALLLYKMLMEAGVPVRLVYGDGITGSSRGPHAWNIVKIGTYWYNVDVTWDDTIDTTKYLLKNNASFTDHIRDSVFTTNAFNIAYPMSTSNFDLSQTDKPVSSISFLSSTGHHAIGDVFSLTATISPIDATNNALTWTSSNPNVASVDGAGNVAVKSAGTAVVTASATDGTGKTAKYTMTAYLVDAPDAWALSEVTSLSARGVISSELMSSYKNNISRAEFMSLIAHVYEYAKGPYNPLSGLPFTDIADSSYLDEISLGYELGIVSGTGMNLFEPDNTLTREQCAKMVSTAIQAITGVEGSSNVVLSYGDLPLINDWALPYVRYTFENGLMQGSSGNFDPKGELTRQQAMVIAERMIVKYGW